MNLVIAGSRTYTNYGTVERAMCGLRPDRILSGGADGVDELGERYAQQHRIPLTIYPANWERYGKAAGPIRYGEAPGQIGHLRGARYWEAMERVYQQAHTALRPGGKMILVIKDHIRNGQRVHIADETAARCAAIGFRLIARHARKVYPLSLWQRRRKERGEPIVGEEDVLVFEVQP